MRRMRHVKDAGCEHKFVELVRYLGVGLYENYLL